MLEMMSCRLHLFPKDVMTSFFIVDSSLGLCSAIALAPTQTTDGLLHSYNLPLSLQRLQYRARAHQWKWGCGIVSGFSRSGCTQLDGVLMGHP